MAIIKESARPSKFKSKDAQIPTLFCLPEHKNKAFFKGSLKRTSPKPKVFALLIGIDKIIEQNQSQYSNSYNLNAFVSNEPSPIIKDCNYIEDWLALPYFDSEIVKLYNETATKFAVTEQLNKINHKAKTGDFVYIFYASVDSENALKLSFDGKREDATMSVEELEEVISSNPSLNFIVWSYFLNFGKEIKNLVSIRDWSNAKEENQGATKMAIDLLQYEPLLSYQNLFDITNDLEIKGNVENLTKVFLQEAFLLNSIYLSAVAENEIIRKKLLLLVNQLKDKGLYLKMNTEISQQTKNNSNYLNEFAKIVVVLSKDYKARIEAKEYDFILKDIDKNSNKYVFISFDGLIDEAFQHQDFIDFSNDRFFDESLIRLTAKLLDSQNTIKTLIADAKTKEAPVQAKNIAKKK